ncbi:hypothetical protein OGAPHI_006747 [Ogataea philodendri]|uniref:Uncharacterized protein n=1 Tax=Ogataea philodendri TaxID=1378263 RepID=A0A9P8T0Y4_9ASCO|nr:uncharacterized protein OGAPHI_006747 [Ogataea philodendri]KAH3661340.1 hypothetical protein OGAPHI_006747 [Ogataea philodendri]
MKSFQFPLVQADWLELLAELGLKELVVPAVQTELVELAEIVELQQPVELEAVEEADLGSPGTLLPVASFAASGKA